MEIAKNLDSDELEHVVLGGWNKMAMRTLFGHYEYLTGHMKFHLNPVDAEKLEMVRFQVENNLPVKRELLYQVAPDFFRMELGELREEERKKILGQKIQLLDVRSG